jgi:SAM-dependent methyltransferase
MVADTLQKCIDKFPFEPDTQVIKDLERALEYRTSGKAPDAIRNTYLQDLAIPQIVLFDILANRFPLVMEAQSLVNRLFCEKASGYASVVLLDIGIGRGLQMERLLKAMNGMTDLTMVRVIGVEISSPALEFTITMMQRLQGELSFKLEFHPIHSAVETMDFETIKSLSEIPDAILLANASLCLHHLQTMAEREKLFQGLRSLNPTLLTLIEPNTDCFIADFPRRLDNAYEHFNALYRFINTLDLTADEKTGLKQFFSTELFDAVALPEEFRFERYQRGEQWISLGKSSQFKSCNLQEHCKQIQIPHIAADVAPSGFVNFQFANCDILSVMALEPDGNNQTT